MFEIQQRDVPQQLVLTERHEHVRQAELPDLNRASMGRLDRSANDYGGVHGLFFTVFHNEEYDANDITFEVCAPIRRDHDGAAIRDHDGAAIGRDQNGAAIRVEPAHREAFVRLTRDQTFPPTIGTAYAAVVEWIHARGLAIAGPPREVYFADFDTAGPDDEVFDVAFPIT